MSKLLFVPVFLFISWLGFRAGPSRTVSGDVTAAGRPLPGVSVSVKGGRQGGTTTDAAGRYAIAVPGEKAVLVFARAGYRTREITVAGKTTLHVVLEAVRRLAEVPEVKRLPAPDAKTDQARPQAERAGYAEDEAHDYAAPSADGPEPGLNTESYNAIHENGFQEAARNPFSTFSIDVDAASYANLRRYLNMGQRPLKDAVRIEEMVNYFPYHYPQPTAEDPFSVTAEVSQCPWNASHRLVHVGLQGREIALENLPPSNLVFLIDVSGSMDSPAKLPLLKAAFGLLVGRLRPQDHVAIVVYAGAAGLVLPPTPGHRKEIVLAALDNLRAGGSTAGGAGLHLAYAVAREHFRKGGNNRVILATDGDFNVGVSSDAEMERLIEQKRETGVFLTVLGFGMGNYKDSKMETLADKGNGNYAYIDNLQEGRKVFVEEFGGTLFTIAQDVKLQVEFNPAQVKAYRLVGYENRTLRHEDFNNDRKDAGDLGAGHSVTALYEIVPAGGETESGLPSVDPPRYQQNVPAARRAPELMTVKLRYKQPGGKVSKRLETTVNDTRTPLARTSDNFRFSAAVAAFGMLLRDSEHEGTATYEAVAALAAAAKGTDSEGYRAEFINLVRLGEQVQARR